MQGCVLENLKYGIELGVYRKDIDVEFISRIYFNGLTGIKDKEMFPLKNYSMKTLMNYYYEYHLRAICTPLGIEKLEHQLKINQL